MPAGALDVLVRFVGDSSSIRDEVGKVEGTGNKIKGWAKGVGAAVGAAFAISAIKDFVGQASALQDAGSAAGEVFEGAVGQVEKFAKGAADAFGLSQRAALEAATTFATFGKSAGLSGAELATFGTDLTGLAGDLASFRGTKPEEAVAAIGSALQGQAEPMRAYGVLLDEGTIKARALAMGLVQATGDADKIKSAQIAATSAQNSYNKAVEQYGKDSPEAALAAQKMELQQSKLNEATAGSVPELTAQQKVLATQAEIFAQTGDAQGDFARTSDSAANQQKALQADIENTQAALGTALLPVIQKLLPYLQSMAEFIEKNASVIVPLAGVLLALAVALKIAALANALFGGTLLAALWPVLLIMAAIAALIAIGILIVKNWDTIKDAAGAVWNAIKVAFDAVLGVVQTVWNWIKDNWPTLLAVLTGPIGVAVLLITRHWSTIKDALLEVWNWIRSAWGILADVLTAPFRIAGELIRAALDRVRSTVQGAWDFVSGLVRTLVDAVTGIPGRIGNAADRIANVIKGPINSVIRAWNRIEFKVPQVDLGPFGKIGGQSWSPPNIPELARGGYVAGTGLAVVHRGETFSGVGGTMGNTYNVNVNVATGVDPVQTGRKIVELIGAFERANGRRVLATGGPA